MRRTPLDVLRAEVREAEDERGVRHLVLFLAVNDVDITSAGAGLGMEPHTVLVPTNRLVASAQPHVAPVARCTCGVYSCGYTDVTITRLTRTVRWDWAGSLPMARPARFDADQYDETVELLSPTGAGRRRVSGRAGC